MAEEEEVEYEEYEEEVEEGNAQGEQAQNVNPEKKSVNNIPKKKNNASNNNNSNNNNNNKNSTKTKKKNDFILPPQQVTSTRAYLEETVTKVIQEALLELARQRPPEPLEFVGNYILNKAKERKK